MTAAAALGTTSSGPWTFQLHPLAWLVVLAGGAGLAWMGRHDRGHDDPAMARQRRRRLVLGLAVLAVALTWPVEDLAAHWSLTALLFQRLLLTMAAAPLLLLSINPGTFARFTAPVAVDAVFEQLTRPVVGVAVFTLVVWTTLLPGAVGAQATSAPARAGIDLAVLAAGFVLWAPVLSHIPGTSRAGPVGTAAYLFVQSILPGFPSVLYIFASHPFYRAFRDVHRALRLTPLADQHLAGVVGKVGTLPVLWSVAWVLLSRAHRAETSGSDPQPWTWLEVDRWMARGQRRGERRHRLPRVPASGWIDVPVVYPPGWDPEDRDPPRPAP